MWMRANIANQNNTYLDVRKVAEKTWLHCGVVAYKPVLKEDRSGRFTRLYDPMRPGQTIEFYQDNDGIQISLNFPAGEKDIETFCYVVKKVCEMLGENCFYMDSKSIGLNWLPEFQQVLVKKSRELVKVLDREFKTGKRQRYIIFGTRFPIVFGRKEFLRMSGNLESFSNIIDEYQKKDIIYADPYFCIVEESTKKSYGVYEVPVGKKVVVPYDPDEVVNHIWYDLYSWTVNLGWVELRYEDFINNIPKGEYFDDAHQIVCLDEATIDELGRKFGYDPMANTVVNRPTWGVTLIDGVKHSQKIEMKNLDTDPLSGFGHAAVFLKWCAGHDLLSDDLLRKYPTLPEQLENTADIRRLFSEHDAFHGKLNRGHLNTDGQRFAAKYVGAGIEGYAGEVDRYALSYFGDERYNCEDFKDEAYLFLPFDKEYENYLAVRIDDAWANMHTSI